MMYKNEKARCMITAVLKCTLVLFLMPHIQTGFCQQTEMSFERYNPTSTLVVPQHHLKSASYPFIDVHNHQPQMATQDLNALIKQMDSMNMKVMVNLTGYGGDILKKMKQNVDQHFANRFVIFTNIDFSGFNHTTWTKKAVSRLEEDVKNGAKGLKIFKELGMYYRDETGKRIAVDDAALDPIWEKCSELEIPVLIHSAAPKAFWDPMDEKNERWLEMFTHADRRYTDKDPAPWDQIMKEQHNVFNKHPKTKFINAHLGWLGNDLTHLSLLMDEFPNMYVDFAAVIAELGRQPKMARQFFEKYQDKILFGKDLWVPSEYTTYFRVLETEDEYFPYHKKYHAFWSMYGMGLPAEILKKVYYKNALSIIPGIDKSLFPE